MYTKSIHHCCILFMESTLLEYFCTNPSTSWELLSDCSIFLYKAKYLLRAVVWLLNIFIQSHAPPERCCLIAQYFYTKPSTSWELLSDCSIFVCKAKHLLRAVVWLLNIFIQSQVPPESCCLIAQYFYTKPSTSWELLSDCSIFLYKAKYLLRDVVWLLNIFMQSQVPPESCCLIAQYFYTKPSTSWELLSDCSILLCPRDYWSGGGGAYCFTPVRPSVRSFVTLSMHSLSG
jgi:hypothetical protein